MIRKIFVLAACGMAVTGCASNSYYSPVEVTRFSAETAEFPPGPIGVRAALEEDAGSPGYAAYQAAVKHELDELGWQVAGTDAPWVAIIDVERWVVDPQGQRSPVTVGGGASVGSYGSGVGLGIGIDLSGRDPERIDTQLSVRIRPTTGGEAIWEGRANFSASANSEYANLRAAAEHVADALFRGFPGNSGETIEVE